MKHNSVQPEKVPHEFIILIELLKTAMSGKTASDYMADDTDYNRLFSIAKHQKIAATVFPYLPEERMLDTVFQQWKQYWNRMVQKEALVQIESALIFHRLEQGKIDYLLIKGAKWNELYGARTREFADVDFLIREADEAAVSQIMLERGYTEKCSTVHNEYTKSPVYAYEVHKMLFRRENAGYAWSESIWTRLQQTEIPHCFQMTETDYFVFELLHMHKHYSDAGIGLRQLADFWLLNGSLSSKAKEIQQAVIGQMKKMGCIAFYNDMTRITKSLFEENGAIPEDWLPILYQNGCFGSRKTLIENHTLQKGRWGVIASALFPDFSHMTDRFPVLKKQKWLLPIMYIVRIASFPFRSEIRRQIPLVIGIMSKNKK